MLKRTLLVLVIAMFMFGFNKEVSKTPKKDKIQENKDEIFMKARLIINDSSNFLDRLNASLKRNQISPPAIVEKLIKIKEISFYATKGGIVKLEVTGLDLIKLLTSYKEIYKDKIQKKGNLKYIYLDDKKNSFLLFKNNKSILANKIALKDAFKKQNIPLSKALKMYSKMIDNSSFLIMFDIAEFMYSLKQAEFHLEELSSVFIVQKFKNDTISLHFQADLGKKAKYVSNILNNKYKVFKPELAKELKKSYKDFPKEYPLKDKKLVFQKFNSILNNVKILNDKNFLKISTSISPVKKEQIVLFNGIIVTVIAAIMIPAYKNYKKKAGLNK